MPTENNKKGPTIVDPKFFQVKLRDCGLDTSLRNYSLIRNKDANNLIFEITKLLAKEFLKDGKDAATLICQLACNIIKEFKPEDIDLKEWFEKVIKMDHWILK